MVHQSIASEREEISCSIHGVGVLQDNITWICVIKDQALVIDPSISDPIKGWISSRNLNLVGVLQTHHHEDHIGGTKGLIRHWPKAEVVASKSDIHRIPFQTISVTDGDEISIMDLSIKVMELKGHTKSHIAFYLKEDEKLLATPCLFCGDVLFGGGCGRLLEGTSLEMFNSLQKINNLPVKTQIYCGHDYTKENLMWARSLRPKDIEIDKRLKILMNQIQDGQPNLPTTLEEEKKTNLFLKAKTLNEFSKLREHKDNW